MLLNGTITNGSSTAATTVNLQTSYSSYARSTQLAFSVDTIRNYRRISAPAAISSVATIKTSKDMRLRSYTGEYGGLLLPAGTQGPTLALSPLPVLRIKVGAPTSTKRCQKEHLDEPESPQIVPFL